MAAAFTAFLISPVVFIPDKFAKVVVFRLIVEIMFIGGVFLLAKHFRLPRLGGGFSRANFSPVAFTVAAFFAAAFLATLFSLQPFTSWWGESMRSEGFFLTIHLVLFFFLLALAADWAAWRKIFSVFGLVAGAVGVFVTLQFLFPPLLNEPFLNSMGSRPSGTLGNPANLAGFMIIWFFVTAGLCLTEKNKDLKIAFALAAIFQFLAIIFSETRAVFLGLLVGGWWFLFFYPVKNFVSNGVYPGLARRRQAALGIFSVIILAVILIFSQTTINAQIQEISPKFGRLTNFNLGDDTIRSRFMAWDTALEGFKDRPIFGYGPENFSIMFDTHYNPAFSTFAFAETWWDRSHNIFIDIGIPLGGVGLAAYLVMMLTAFYVIRRKKIESAGVDGENGGLDSKIFYHALLAALIAYFTQNLFNFDSVSSWMAFFLVLAFAEFISRSKRPEWPEVKINFEGLAAARKIALTLVILFIVTAAWKTNIQPFFANWRSNEALKFINEGTFVQLNDAYERLFQNPTLQDNSLNNQFAAAVLFYAKPLREENPEMFKKTLLKVAGRLDQNIARQPWTTKLYLDQANLYIHLGGLDPTAAEKAVPYIEKAWEISPGRQITLNTWAKILIIQNKNREAMEKLEQSALINPFYSETFWWLGIINSYEGKFESGEKYFDLAQNKGFKINDENNLRLRAALYRDTAQYAKLPDIYLELLKQKPSDLETRTQLLIAYLQTGKTLEAKKQSNVILQAAPSSQPIIDKLFQEIKPVEL